MITSRNSFFWLKKVFVRCADLVAHRAFCAQAASESSKINLLHRVASGCFLACLGGCSTVGVATKATEMALSAVGISLPDGSRAPKFVEIRVKGTDDMNSGEDGKALSAIVRLYKLKEQNNFLTTPYGSFGRPDKEKQALGDALVEAKELILSPGQTLELKEKLDADTAYLGVVTLFRSPSAQRWKLAFAANDDTRKSGISLEVRNCMMTATGTAPVGMTLAESSVPSPIKCN